MTPRPFQERDVIAAPDGSGRWRVLFKGAQDTYLFDMNDRLAMPRWRNTQELQAEIDAEELTAIGACPTPPLGASHEARAVARFEKFKPAFTDPVHRDDMLLPEGRSRAFRLLKLTYASLTMKIFLSAVRKWWRGGQGHDCLTDDYGNCGRQAINTKDLESESLAQAKKHMVTLALAIEGSVIETRKKLKDHTKSGKPRERREPVSPTVFKVDRLVLRVFLRYFKWKLAEKGRSVRDAYREMCTEVLVEENADGSFRNIAARAHPSFRVFEDWFYRLHDHKTRRVAIVGEKGYGKNERELIGNESSRVRRVGTVASGDATIWNIGIVSRFAGRRIIGTAVVFRIRCKTTGILLGIATSLREASFTVAAAAIANMLEDKVKFCARYGITIRPEDWPAQGLTSEYEFDRGETNNHCPDSFIAKTGTRIRNLPGDRPDMKGGVESDFNVLQLRLNGKTPAACVKTWEQRTRADWKFKAELDIDQFMHLLLLHELDKMKQPRDDHPISAGMISMGLTSSPLHCWNYSVQHEGGGLKQWDLEEVQLSLMRRARGILDMDGLRFKRCVYANEELSKAHVFAQTRRAGKMAVQVAYDERLVDQVYITHMGGQELEHPLVCRLNDKLPHQLDYFGKCFEEVFELLNQRALNVESHRQDAVDSTSKTIQAHKEIVAQAHADTAAAGDRGSKAQQKRDLPANRRAEKYRTEPEQAFVPLVGSAGAPASVPAPPAATSPAPEAPSTRRSAAVYADLLDSI